MAISKKRKIQSIYLKNKTKTFDSSKKIYRCKITICIAHQRSIIIIIVNIIIIITIVIIIISIIITITRRIKTNLHFSARVTADVFGWRHKSLTREIKPHKNVGKL